MIIKVVLMKDKPEYFSIDVSEDKYYLVKKRLILENTKIVNVLKRMKKDKLIRSIFMPSNKRIQKELDELVKAKKVIKDSIKKITAFYS